MDILEDYIGLPFQEFGRTRAGVDCWGLVRLIYAEKFKIDLPSYEGLYADCRDSASLGALVPEQANAWMSVPMGQERFGDVVVLRMRGVPMHTALVAMRGFMLHVHEGIDAVVEDYRRMAWKDRIIGFYRHADRA